MEVGVFIGFKDRKNFGSFPFAMNGVIVNYSIVKIGNAGDRVV